MIKIIKYSVLGLIVLALLGTATLYGVLTLSLPSLSGSAEVSGLKADVTLARDERGQAIIHAENRIDAAYALGFAHGQDRFFQMDLLRRNAAGELSELFGPAALGLDKRMRFHQFRKRANAIVEQLPAQDKLLLARYSRGVNDALKVAPYSSFEYLLTGTERRPWASADSLLVIYSMYLDLQMKTLQRDLARTRIKDAFGEDMLAFLFQQSPYQAAIDGSTLPLYQGPLVDLPSEQNTLPLAYNTHNMSGDSLSLFPVLDERYVKGSNNWAVTGDLTETGHAMLADDMHLGINVPVIWYRAQLNYQHDDTQHQVTGVTLPGAPTVVVGANGHIAWGFTNAYIDTANWVQLDDTTETQTDFETIKVKGQDAVTFAVESSRYGPVKTLKENRYALAWTAHQDYAVNLKLADIEQTQSVQDALLATQQVGIPVQNMLVVDSQGNAAWQLTGAIPKAPTPANVAISESQYNPDFAIAAEQGAQLINPETGRLMSANARTISSQDIAHYGDGGYALGARGVQIQKGLEAKNTFTEADFYAIQLDNQADFLNQWHTLLVTALNTQANEFSDDLAHLEAWQGCACPDSVGYTLVRHFRYEVLKNLFAPLADTLRGSGTNIWTVANDLEPAAWMIFNQFPDSWIEGRYVSYPDLFIKSYQTTKERLLNKHSDTGALTDLTWGKTNALAIKHPFSAQIPVLGQYLNMPTAPGFGDSFMPAVQRPEFGASQRLFVQPGHEDTAILTVPGGQSAHPLSPFYQLGFADYVANENTPLLPGEAIAEIRFKAVN